MRNERKSGPGASHPERPVQSRSLLGRAAREPLLHFALVGVLLFVAHGLLNPETADHREPRRIELTGGDLRQMTAAWLAQGRAAPTPEELRSLVGDRVREEVLYREALALGLDENDTIVRRRLAQKMEFLAEEASAVSEPTDEDLRAWYRAHPERATLPGRATFRHLYFSPDQRGPEARGDAARALGTIAGDDAGLAAGDPFMFQDYYADRSPEDVASIFGRSFADTLFGLSPGPWQGPIESGYGWHLIRLDSRTPPRVPDFESVRADVRADWIGERRDAEQRQAFERLRERYEIVVPEIHPEALDTVASR